MVGGHLALALGEDGYSVGTEYCRVTFFSGPADSTAVGSQRAEPIENEGV